ncbi:cutinase family protein [Rhodococcus sp. UFZ-B548]|uniref:cutinase family protein n=1 Tax=Rhodococcus sp. UFZ-B548 TaxID=2742212 RepID=UPI0015F52B05|nr:cutinase family protein [Rhodococcus sp. UFZ-B548]
MALVPIRGSGENKESAYSYSPAAKDKSWEGGTLRRLLKQFYNDNPDLAHVPIVEVPGPDDYPAVPVENQKEMGAFKLADSPVYQSSQKGVKAALDAMLSFKVANNPTSCKPTQFILIGYSQGAMVAREAAKTMPDWVSSVFLYGDPWQKPDADGTNGTGKGGNGVFRAHYPTWNKAKDSYYTASGFDRRSLCHQNDVICGVGVKSGWDAGNGNIEQHLNYFKDPEEASAESAALAAAVKEAINDGGTVTDPTVPRSDVSIVIDTTGSMGSYINNAKYNAALIAQRVIEQDNGSKVSLVEYRDHGDAFVARTIVNPTSDISSFTAGVNSLYATGGGDTPEAVYSGIVESITSFESSTVRRSMIVIGDAPPHDPEPVTGYTRDQIGRYLSGTETVPPKSLDASLRAATSGTEPEAEDPARAQPVTPPTATVSSPAREAALSPALALTSEFDPAIGVSLYTLSADSSLTAMLEPLSQASGGQVFDISDASKVGDAIISAIDDAASAPVAVLGIPDFAMTGSEVTISGAASTGASKLAYEFDFDGDGSFEVSSATGIVTHTFLSPGIIQVKLRITDIDGRTSTVSAPVEVVADESVLNEESSPTTGSESGSAGSSGFGSLTGGSFGP